MPRQSEKRLKGQTQVDQRDLYDATVPDRRVQAQPVDPYVSQHRSSDADALLRFSQQFNQIQGQAQGLFDRRAQELKKEGATSAMKGEGQARFASDAFIEGYETQKGEAAVADYIAEREALHSKAAQLEPNEYAAEAEKINQKYLNGASDYFIRGFVPAAMQEDTKYNTKYQQVLKARVDQDYLTDVRKKAYASTKALMDDPEVTDKAVAIRNLLTEQQLHGKSVLKSDRNAINAEFIDTLGAEAIRGGNPDLMGFTAIKDKDGRALIDDPEQADRINQIINMAMSKKDTMREKAAEAAKNAKKDAKEQIERQIIIGLEYGQKNPAELDKVETFILEQAHLLEPDELTKYIQRFHNLQIDENWPKANNANHYRMLYNRAVLGELDANDWATASDYVTRETYMELARVNAAAVKALGKESGGVTTKEIFNRYRKMALENAGADALLPTFDAKNGAKRAEIINFGMDSRMANWLSNTQNKPQDLDYKTMMGWYTEVMKEAEEFAPTIKVPDLAPAHKPTGTARVTQNKTTNQTTDPRARAKEILSQVPGD